MACDSGQGPMQDQPLPAWTPRLLTTQALVLGGDGTLLLTLSLLAPTVVVIRVPILGTHRPIGPITSDTVTGTMGTATAGQAYSIELAGLHALVWSGQGGQRGWITTLATHHMQGIHRHKRW
jgi:hypothetical protein